MDSTKRIVEINGVKVEVDLRTATRVDQFKVGDSVKLLLKKYGDNYESYFGMIVAFDEFKTLPTIVVAYINTSTWSTPLNFAYINAKTVDAEICMHDQADIGVSRADILEQFDRELAKKEQELREIHSKRAYFNSMFGKVFENRTEKSVG